MRNIGAGVGDGAGVSAARIITGKNVGTVLTGNCGPNAFQILSDAGIKVVTGISGIVTDAIQNYTSGKLPATPKANVPGHFGMERTMDSNMLRDLRHPIRLKILSCLTAGEANVSQLLSLVAGVQQGRLSSHLSLLRRLGYVYSRRSGRYIYYGILNPRVRKLLQAISLEAGPAETGEDNNQKKAKEGKNAVLRTVGET
jgi:predicted Fe-Mo cluster-binding NifX family protein